MLLSHLELLLEHDIRSSATGLRMCSRLTNMSRGRGFGARLGDPQSRDLGKRAVERVERMRGKQESEGFWAVREKTGREREKDGG